MVCVAVVIVGVVVVVIIGVVVIIVVIVVVVFVVVVVSVVFMIVVVVVVGIAAILQAVRSQPPEQFAQIHWAEGSIFDLDNDTLNTMKYLSYPTCYPMAPCHCSQTFAELRNHHPCPHTPGMTIQTYSDY